MKGLCLFVCLVVSTPLMAQVVCENGSADGYPCQAVDLMDYLANSETGGGSANDIWGWTDPETGREYAILGKSGGTAFIDITDPVNAQYLGFLPTHTSNSSWRDMKTYANHVFIVSEAGGHGMQVFDLTQLRGLQGGPQTFSETAHYDGFGNAHNIAIDEDSGFAFALGADCSGGLHMINIAIPTSPVFAGCFSADGYTHDAQCVVYQGPDTTYQSREICFNYNEDTLTIVDVEDKNNPVQLSRVGYTGVGYTHQGWLTEDQAYLLMNDETDELENGHPTRTYIWDVRDLDNPQFIDYYEASNNSSDHNLYIIGDVAYAANYRSGLRIFGTEQIASGILEERAFFDIVPSDNNAGTSGAWSVYPFYASGNVVVSGIAQGFYVLRPILCEAPAVPQSLSALADGDNAIALDWADVAGEGVNYNVYRAFGTCADHAPFELVAQGLTQSSYRDDAVSGDVSYVYQITSRDVSGLCESEAGLCTEATTSGTCNAEPWFDGVATVDNLATAACGLSVSWTAAVALCGAEVTYDVFRATDEEFLPGPENLVAGGLEGLSFEDHTVVNGTRYAYIVRATHTSNGVSDENLQRVSATPTGPVSDGTWLAGAESGDPAMADISVWSTSNTRANSGSRAYYSGYQDDQCSALVCPPLTLSAGNSSQLTFTSWWDIESQWDGGVVEITTDGGSNWTRLDLVQGYPDLFRSSSDKCGYATNSPCFTGLSSGWEAFTADLSAYNGGPEVMIRWNFSTDGGVTEDGWFIDDIAITHAGIAADCTTDCPPFTAVLDEWPVRTLAEFIEAINCAN